jgi:tetratricopeptide (TPR) repeat protein
MNTGQRTAMLATAALLGFGVIAQVHVNDSTTVHKGTDKTMNVVRALDVEASERVTSLTREGIALFNKGQYDAAIEKLEEALLLDPENIVVLANLGTVEDRNGHHEKAIGYLEHAWALSDPPVVALAVPLGLAYYNAGEMEKAIGVFDLAIPQLSDDFSLGAAYFNRGMAYAKTGKCELARTDYENAKKMYASMKAAKTELKRLEGMIQRCKDAMGSAPVEP